MARKVNNKVTTYNDIQDLCVEIYQGDYVLVVGKDIILNDKLGGDSEKFIIEECHLTTDIRKRYKNEKLDLRNILRNEWEYNIEEEINPDLFSLIATKCFRLVITTTFDDYIEKVMRKVWGEELLVINIFDENKENYARFRVKSEYGMIPPTLVYAFGCASTKYDFTYTENDAIRCLSRWMNASAPTEIINYINEKRKKILAIGCKFEDWYFRFFWYCFKQDIESIGGDVAISLDENSPEDQKLISYLQRINVSNKGNSRDFLHNIISELQNPNYSVYRIYSQSLQTGGIFISYASEDFPIACQIYSVLRKAKYAVWFDNAELRGGDGYDKRISNAIKEAKIFIPILSQQTVIDITNNIERYYKNVEWEAITDNIKCKIIPLTIYGFNISKNRDLLPEIFRTDTIVDWSKNGIRGLLDAVK